MRGQRGRGGIRAGFLIRGHFSRNPEEVRPRLRLLQRREFQKEGSARTKVQREGAYLDEQGAPYGWRERKEGKWEGELRGVNWHKPCGVRTLQRDNAFH